MYLPTWGIDSERRWTLFVPSATNVTVCVGFQGGAVPYRPESHKKGGKKGCQTGLRVHERLSTYCR